MPLPTATWVKSAPYLLSFAVVVPDQEPRLLTEWCCFSQDYAALHLGDPCIGWRPGYPEMHNAPRAEFDDEEDEQRTKEQVVDGPECGAAEEPIAGPYLVSMVMEWRKVDQF